MLRLRLLAPFTLLALVAVGCGADDEESTAGACSVEEQSGCSDGLVCQDVPGGEPACFCNELTEAGCDEGLACEVVDEGNTACFAPVTVTGRVFDLADGNGVEGAHVVARDVNGAPASSVAVSGVDGSYELAVPTPRQADGSPIETRVTLRADASGYLTFPSAPRVALPFDVSDADGDPPVVMSSATDVGLIALNDGASRGTISGTVLADAPGGTLVVAGGQSGSGGGATGIAGIDGHYTVFNVPAGNVTVRGYLTGLQLESAAAEVVAGETTEGVDLSGAGEATAVVSGKVEIVNPGDGSDTSVILVVDETFDATAARGEAPPGLRIANVTGQWSIAGVPDGRYVVLAAFENDMLVRDPDTSIGGTELVRITVNGANQDIAEGFKITGSLAVVSPDGEEATTAQPTFRFADDSGEDHYEVRVYDAFGERVWEKLDVPGVSGDNTVSVAYDGEPLESGWLYQFRATSIKRGGTPLATTEDLRGVFVVE